MICVKCDLLLKYLHRNLYESCIIEGDTSLNCDRFCSIKHSVVEYCTSLCKKHVFSPNGGASFWIIKLFIYITHLPPWVREGLSVIVPTPARSPAVRRGDWCCRCRSSARSSSWLPPAGAAACSSGNTVYKQIETNT